MAHRMVYGLWEHAAYMHAMGIIISRKNSGTPPIYLTEFVQEGVKNLP